MIIERTKIDVAGYIMWAMAVSVAIIVILYFCVYQIILGENAYYLVHDHLDWSGGLYRGLWQTGAAFAPNDTPLDFFMGGVRRGLMPSAFNSYAILAGFLPPIVAQQFNAAMIVLTAFGGMLLFLSRVIFPHIEHGKALAVLFSALFAALPHFPSAGISVAGLPLIFYGLWLAGQGRILWPALITMYFVVGSSLTYIGVFLLPYLFVAALGPLRTGANLRFMLSYIMLVCALYAAANWGFLTEFLDLASPRTIRHNITLGASGNILDGIVHVLTWENLFNPRYIQLTLNSLIFGQYHADPLADPYIVALTCIGAAASVWLWKKKGIENKANLAPSLFWAFFIFLLSSAIAFGYFPIVRQLEVFLDVPYFNLARFHWLQPFFWMVLAALSAAMVLALVPRRLRILPVILIVVFAALQLELSVREGYANREAQSSRPVTIGQFLGAEVFADIKDAIGRPPQNYRVVSLGIHPAVALMNDFYTLDGYFPNYERERKMRFRKVIAPELEFDEWARKYYDGWGGRMYIFNSKLKACNYRCLRLVANRYVKGDILLKINPYALLEFSEGRDVYVFSPARIANWEEINLTEKGIFEQEGSYRIYLYLLAAREAICVPASKTDLGLECGPAGGQIGIRD